MHIESLQLILEDSEAPFSLGEVRYYFQCRIKGLLSTLAVISLYSAPLSDLLIRSHGTLIACKYCGDLNLVVVDVACIKAVVAMIPYSPPGMDKDDGYYFLVERPGLDITNLGDINEVFSTE